VQHSSLYIVLAGLAVLAFYILQPFLVALALAAIFATILYPCYRLLPQRGTLLRNLSALVVTLLGLLCVIIPLSFVGSRLLAQSEHLYASLTSPGATEQINLSLTNAYQAVERATGLTFAPLDLAGTLTNYAEQVVAWVTQNVGGLVSGTAAFLIDLLIFCMALFFLLRDGEALKHIFITTSPLHESDNELIVRRLKQAVGSVVRGNLLMAVILGCLTGLGLALLGVPDSLLWGAIAIVASLVPFVGAALIWIPGALFLLATGHALAALGLVLWGTLLLGVIDNILRPFLMGSGTHLHPLLVLLFVLGGVGFFGPAGIFLGPLALSLLVVLLSVYADMRRASAS
jgi:predicted PurR-regulated permease PerM